MVIRKQFRRRPKILCSVRMEQTRSSGIRVRKGHPLPLICVGDAYIPLGQDGCQATDSHSRGVRKLVVPEPPEPTSVHPSFLTVPLSFGLETVACFPKSYRWMSEEARSRSLDSGTASSSPGVGSSPRRRLDRLTGVCAADGRFLELDGLEVNASTFGPP